MTKMRPATEDELARWDELVLANPDGGHIMQTRAWGEFKAKYHWRPHFFVYEGEHTIAALFLERPMPGFGTIWYIPKGPGVADEAQLTEVIKATQGFKGLAVKVEPELKAEDVNMERLMANSGLRPASAVQFKATVIVDISPDEEALLANFKQKTRYNVRLSLRNGVMVEPVPATTENLEEMYRLVKTTQSRASYFVRSKVYFQDYWRMQADAGQGQLFFAKHEGLVLAGAFVQHLGAHSWYKDGGSVREHSELMAPYALQWQIMLWLKQKNVTSYDMVGAPPRDQVGSGHVLDSLYRFKAGFNPEITEFVGTLDLPLSPRYKLWRQVGERLNVLYQSKIKHDYLY